MIGGSLFKAVRFLVAAFQPLQSEMAGPGKFGPCCALLFCLVKLTLGATFYPSEDDLIAWQKHQHIAALRDLVIPSAEDQFSQNELPNTAEGRCASDLKRTITSLNESWALQMLDADAKPPSGILNLKMNWMGDFYECQTVRAPATAGSPAFSGRYCNFQLSASVMDVNLSVSLGLCVPSTCTLVELKNLTALDLVANRSAIQGFPIPSFQMKVSSCSTEIPFDAPAIGMLVLLSLFIALMAAGTSLTLLEKWSISRQCNAVAEPSSICYTILEEPKEDVSSVQEVLPPKEVSILKKFLKCFCVLTNGSKILATGVKGDLGCVHGIRFLSMTWVILGHTYLSAQALMLSGNMRETLDQIDTWPFQAIMQGTFSVDSFFLLSGFLLSYLFLKEASSKDGKIPWGYFYVHRYWRLTPVYAIVLGFNTALTMYVSDGPLWPSGSTDPNCRKSWWWNMLYINNFQGMTESCMAWSWYLANDMQFYVISPIFLYALYRWPKIGLSLISGVLVSSWIATGWICYHYQLAMEWSADNGFAALAASGQKVTTLFEKIYVKPYTRIGPFLIGMILGYAVWKQMNHGKPISKVLQLVGWALAIAGGLGMVYGFYHAHLTQVGYSVLTALNRSVFAASLAWLIFACLNGCGGPVNAILSWNFLVPLSRLTYCAYLVHPIILGSYYQSLRSPMQFTHSVLVTLFLGFVVMSYATAFVCSLAFESSLMAVEKLVLSRLRKPEQRS